MSAIDLLALQSAVIDDLKARFPALVFEAHGGRFNIAELDAYGVKAPEVRIAVLAANPADKGRNAYVGAQLAAYIIAGSDRYLRAPERGLAIASSLMRYLRRNAPGAAVEGGQPDRVGWQNLYSSDTRERGKHLGLVSWLQTFEITDPDNVPALDDLREIACVYDLADSLDPTPEATDTIELEGPP